MNLFKPIDIETLPGLESPSKTHQYDGLAIGRLVITQGNQSNETLSFDHGYPPKEIKALVKEILSIAENIE